MIFAGCCLRVRTITGAKHQLGQFELLVHRPPWGRTSACGLYCLILIDYSQLSANLDSVTSKRRPNAGLVINIVSVDGSSRSPG